MNSDSDWSREEKALARLARSVPALEPLVHPAFAPKPEGERRSAVFATLPAPDPVARVRRWLAHAAALRQVGLRPSSGSSSEQDNLGQEFASFLERIKPNTSKLAGILGNAIRADSIAALLDRVRERLTDSDEPPLELPPVLTESLAIASEDWPGRMMAQSLHHRTALPTLEGVNLPKWLESLRNSIPLAKSDLLARLLLVRLLVEHGIDPRAPWLRQLAGGDVKAWTPIITLDDALAAGLLEVTVHADGDCPRLAKSGLVAEVAGALVGIPVPVLHAPSLPKLIDHVLANPGNRQRIEWSVLIRHLMTGREYSALGFPVIRALMRLACEEESRPVLAAKNPRRLNDHLQHAMTYGDDAKIDSTERSLIIEAELVSEQPPHSVSSDRTIDCD